MNEQLIKERQYILGQIDELKHKLDAINAQIIGELGDGFKGDIAGYRVAVSRRASFKADIAEQLFKTKRITKKQREAVLKPATLDSAKVKIMFPDIYEQACVVSDPYVTIKG